MQLFKAQKTIDFRVKSYGQASQAEMKGPFLTLNCPCSLLDTSNLPLCYLLLLKKLKHHKRSLRLHLSSPVLFSSCSVATLVCFLMEDLQECRLSLTSESSDYQKQYHLTVPLGYICLIVIQNRNYNFKKNYNLINLSVWLC